MSFTIFGEGDPPRSQHCSACSRRIPRGATTYLREDPDGDLLAVLCHGCAMLEPYAVPQLQTVIHGRTRR